MHATRQQQRQSVALAGSHCLESLQLRPCRDAGLHKQQLVLRVAQRVGPPLQQPLPALALRQRRRQLVARRAGVKNEQGVLGAPLAAPPPAAAAPPSFPRGPDMLSAPGIIRRKGPEAAGALAWQAAQRS